MESVVGGHLQNLKSGVAREYKKKIHPCEQEWINR